MSCKIIKPINLDEYIFHNFIFSVFFGYLWFCVVSLFQIIFVVNSSDYRARFGKNPLKTRPNPSTQKPPPIEKSAKKLRFSSSVELNDKSIHFEPAAKVKKWQQQTQMLALNQSRRLRNDYIEMRHNYLNQPHFDIAREHGNGQIHSRF